MVQYCSTVVARAYILEEGMQLLLFPVYLANFKSTLKIVTLYQYLVHRYSAVHSAEVTIISYKPLSDLKFVRCLVTCPLLL